MSYSDLRHEQARQAVDAEQVYAAYRAAKAELGLRFAGSMSWKTINGGTYLYRKANGVGRSLGPRSDRTSEAHRAFHEGRDRLRARLARLAGRLDEMAPVNRALGLGRVPKTSGRILRGIDAAGLMGGVLGVVGANALFAYERLAGVRIEGGLLATGDIDLLFDARRKLKLAGGTVPMGLLKLLQSVDRTFTASGPGSFRAVNDDGFMVDLVGPSPKDRFSTPARSSVGGPDDLQAVEIEGLAWLVNSPRCAAVVLDERGYPLGISAPDPRAFAIHKAWLSSRGDREPIKRARDRAQAELVARITAERLPHLPFDGADLSALPLRMRRAAADLLPGRGAGPAQPRLEPDW